MSKPKNRIICPDCGKPKMVFESESKAKNFIKFNNQSFFFQDFLIDLLINILNFNFLD